MYLAELMKKRKMNDCTLSRKIGCAKSTVQQWRTGLYQPRIEFIVPLCQALDCSADELLGVDAKIKQKLPLALARDLYQSVTNEGEYNSDMLHQMATAFSRSTGKLTKLELWFRELAETVYKIELAAKKPKAQREAEANQLKLDF